MGAVSRMAKERGRRGGRRAPGWDLLWLLAGLLVYAPAVLLLPRSREPAALALFWAVFGTLWVLLVALADDLLRRLRPRPTLVEAAVPRPPSRAWRFAFYVAIGVTTVQFAAASVAWRRIAALVVMVLGIVVVEKGVAAVARRRDEKRRRKEVADLARQF